MSKAHRKRSGSLSSYSFSSSDEDSRRKYRRHRNHHDDDANHRRHSHSRKSKRSKSDPSKLPPAPSDFEQLRAHFQFVLPTDDDDNNVNATSNNTSGYGSTWQQRMVQHYHSHLYKEYVLADLSHVLSKGKVGLRWRTENEVFSGRGFRTCGNLKCEGVSTDQLSTGGDDDSYRAKIRSALGVGVAENGGKVPIGVVLPSEGASRALETYLQSCSNETSSYGEQSGNHRSDHKKKHKKYRDKRSNYSPQRLERKEEKRLSQLAYGIGLHDYEVDFAYVEHGKKKRELVKVRLCIRCAPLLFVSKSSAAKVAGDTDAGPATKAREAREKAARSHSLMANAANAIEQNGVSVFNNVAVGNETTEQDSRREAATTAHDTV
mmetsp:Transcript_3246/g.7135  ORF Transcript_3246/g.7135 Transcript_3246/m.7135 type:complete len:377 (-) Transcript_3246:1120-2250(-)